MIKQRKFINFSIFCAIFYFLLKLRTIFVTKPQFVDDLPKVCQELIRRNVHKQQKYSGISKTWTIDVVLRLNSNKHLCSKFRHELSQEKIPIETTELKFPIGFTIAVYKDIPQVARLLRAIYREHNFYVIHVDQNSADAFYEAVVELKKCFGPNVKVIPRNESVQVLWCKYTVLELELIAAKHLLQMGSWKYLINLTGQEFPLKTNFELVAALKALNGSNLVEGTVKRFNKRRALKSQLPFRVTWTKGGVHAALRREFVQFMLYDDKAVQIKKVLYTEGYNKCPDETFFSTLAYNPQLGAPGACSSVYEKENPSTDSSRLHGAIRFKLWYNNCATKLIRSICVLGSPQIKDLLKSGSLFANKFHMNYYPESYDCLELALAKRAANPLPFNASYIANRYCSIDHI